MRTLESLSLFSHLCGLFSVFLGLVVSFVDLLNGDFKHIHMGIYIFIIGYAQVKISSKISDVIIRER